MHTVHTHTHTHARARTHAHAHTHTHTHTHIPQTEYIHQVRKFLNWGVVAVGVGRCGGEGVDSFFTVVATASSSKSMYLYAYAKS